MSANRNRITLTVVVLVAFMALLVGLFFSQHLTARKTVDVEKFHGAYLQKPRAVAEFELVGVDEKPFNNAKLKGQWTMIFFGFTNCGYLCPTTMAELGKFYRSLEDKKVRHLPNVVMISIDPERDSLEKLKVYVKAFDKHFSGARGDMKKVDAMTKEFGVVHMKVAGKEGDENYDIQHSGAVMLFNPQGQLNAFFSAPHNAKALVEDYMQLTS